MTQSILTSDGSTAVYEVGAVNDGVHISVSGGLGGGSLAIEQRVTGVAVPLLDGSTAIAITAADDSLYNLQFGDVFRLTLTGSTTPTIGWSINGNISHRNDL